MDKIESEPVRATCAHAIQRVRRVIREKRGYVKKSVIHEEDYTFFLDFRKFRCFCPFSFRLKRIFNSLLLGGGPCI